MKENKLDEVFDLKGNKFIISVEDLEIDDCSAELAIIRNAAEKGVTSLSVYNRYYSEEAKNKIAKNIKVNQYTLLDENSPKRTFDEIKNDLKNRSLLMKFQEKLDNLLSQRKQDSMNMQVIELQ